MQRLVEGHPFNQQVAGEIVELWPNVLATISALRSFDSWSKPKTPGNDQESEAQGNEPLNHCRNIGASVIERFARPRLASVRLGFVQRTVDSSRTRQMK
jgi:hypothetical protein